MSTSDYKVSEPRLYVIHDKPLDKLPFRRLQTEGADVLKVNELLQIALGKADGFENVLNEYGIQMLSTLHSVSDIVELLNIDHIQATRLLAILALGKRVYSQPQEGLIKIRGIEDVYSHYAAMGSLTKEQLRLLVINSRYQVVHEETLSVGTADTLFIKPIDILQPAVVRNQTAIILVHNHPTGDATPSEEDISFTKRIVDAANLMGIELLDHVIITHNSYSSCLIKNTKTKDVDKP